MLRRDACSVQHINNHSACAHSRSRMHAFVTQAWTTARLQSRLADKISTLRMELRPSRSPLPPLVILDAERARQVLLNLLVNAIKFTPEGGSVTMSVDVVGADMCRVRVTDTGIGLRPEGIARLFMPFSQAEARICCQSHAAAAAARAFLCRLPRRQPARRSWLAFFSSGYAVSIKSRIISACGFRAAPPQDSTRERFGGTGLGLAISRRCVCVPLLWRRRWHLRRVESRRFVISQQQRWLIASALAPRSIAMEMGGDLTVHSDGLGRGSEFTASFRLVPAPGELPAPAAETGGETRPQLQEESGGAGVEMRPLAGAGGITVGGRPGRC